MKKNITICLLILVSYSLAHCNIHEANGYPYCFGNVNDTLSVTKGAFIKGSIFKDKRFSTELFFQLPYHFIHSPDWLYEDRVYYKNDINYGCGIMISKYLEKVKLSTGFFISQLNFYRTFETTQDALLDKIVFYSFVPLSVSFTGKKLVPFIAISFNTPYYYSNNSNLELSADIISKTYVGSPSHGYNPPDPSLLTIDFEKSESIIVGVGYKKELAKSLDLFFEFFGSYLTNPSLLVGNNYIYEERFVIGVDVRVELGFFNN